MKRPEDVTMLSTAEFDNPFWTNKQHQAVDLAARGHRVLYIESLGLRRPSASAQDLGRIGRRFIKGLRGPRKVRDNLWVWSPLVLPLQRFAAVRLFNRIVLSVCLRICHLLLGMRRDILWSYNPMTTRFLGLRGYGFVIYNCVDDIAAQPGMPAQAIREAEAEFAEEADVVFCTAPDLAEKCRRFNPATEMVGNVADYAHFSTARSEGLEVPADLSLLPAGPRLGYVGAISGYKLDFELVRHVALSRPDWQVVLIGKVGEGDPWTDPQLLEGIGNLHLLGPRSYEELPAYLKGFDVALLPSTLNEYTAGMDPMKFNEYLGAGCPVVATALPALKEREHVVRVAYSHEDFLCGIEEALAGDCPSLEDRVGFAARHTYSARTDRMFRVIEDVRLARSYTEMKPHADSPIPGV
jgi:glycosyltransferase involved in cell wall biosynthesis